MDIKFRLCTAYQMMEVALAEDWVSLVLVVSSMSISDPEWLLLHRSTRTSPDLRKFEMAEVWVEVEEDEGQVVVQGWVWVQAQ